MAATKKGRPGRGYETVPVLVRFPATMLERIAAYHAQIASQDWRLTSRQDAILMVCERGLQAVEQGPAPFTPPLAVVEGDDGSPALPTHRDRRSISPEQFEQIVATAAHYDKLSLRQLAQLLHDRGIYSAHDRGGTAKPVSSGVLHKWLKQARAASLR